MKHSIVRLALAAGLTVAVTGVANAQTTVSPDAEQTAWLPDGRRVVSLRRADEIWVLDVETGVERLLGRTPVAIDPHLVPSRDGRAIYVSVSSSSADIWLLERDQ